MNSIREEIQAIAENIAVLAQRSAEIENITKVLEDFASQTNLLALNASFEAAGAGAAGRRFAIVADEIRKLAEESARETSRVSNLVQQVQSEIGRLVALVQEGVREVESGYKTAHSASGHLEDIAKLAEQSAQLAQQISSLVQSQVSAVEQVDQAVQKITQTAQRTEIESQAGRRAAETVRLLSQTLIKNLARFRLPELGGSMSTATTPDLLQSFLEEAWETVAVFEQTAEFLAIRRHEPLVVMAHRLKGSAGLYGFPQISNLGALAERILEAAPRYTEPQQAKVIDFMAQLTAVLINALENITIQGQEGRVGLELGHLGAAALLQELTALNPEAFANEDLEPPGNTPESAQPVGVVEELRNFYRQNSDFWEFFAPEILENLDRVTGALANLQSGGEHSEHLRILFRAMHTVKGAAYSVGCKPIGALAHQLEELMVAVREGHRPWNNQVEHLISQGAQVLGQMIAVAEGKDPLAAQDPRQQAFCTAGPAGPTVGAGSPSKPPGTRLCRYLPSVQPARPSSTASVRVSLERLDALLNLAGEALAARSRLELLAQRFEQVDQLLETARQRLLRTTADFESRYLNPRLSPAQEALDSPSPEHPGQNRTGAFQRARV
jgi:HPt (histidine-containing phosphotransfer) domain-containing protein